MATPPSRTPPFREDCWSEDATWTLVGAWGRRFVELNRGSLRQKDWQSVADAVNSVHGGDPKARRTDVQCKNRIDTLKKKYKAEKARVSDSPGYSSTWPFYDRMDELIGSLVLAKKPSPAEVSVSVSASPPMGIPLLPYRKPVSVVAQPGVLVSQKRPASDPAPVVDDSYFRRNYSAVAAAAAAEVEDDDDVEDSESEAEEVEEASDGDGMRRLARAIERLGEMYERVEGEKQRQMVELEKQRMQFTKDMEVQRMQLFMDTQVQLEKIKRAKRSNSDVLHRLAFSSAVGLWGELLAHDGKP